MENREIKFRAFWNERIYEVNFIDFKDNNIDLDVDGVATTVSMKFVDLLQYTRLKDKNGKEIYEGDVIHLGGNGQITDEEGNWWGANGPAGYSSPLVEVKWIDSITGFEPFNNYDCDCGVSYNASKVKVIGNIYENPELLSKLKE